MDDSAFDARLRALTSVHPGEREFHALCELFRGASPGQRARLRREVAVTDGSWTVPDSSTLADGVPRALPAAERLRDHLTWHAIEGGAHDVRDNLMSIVLAFHAAQYLGLDVQALFDEAAAIAPPEMAEVLACCPRRPPGDRSLAAFHYREVRTTGGVRYESHEPGQRSGPAESGAAMRGATTHDARPRWTIRRALPRDVPRLGTFAAALFRQAYEPTHPEPALSRYLANAFAEPRVAAAISDRTSTILLVEDAEGGWLGYAALREGGPREPTTTLEVPLAGESPLEIVRFYVDAAWHGRGVARALMQACEEESRARGCDVLWLQTWQQAPQALRFYAKSGFAVHGRAIFRFGERADADFILARSLPR